MSRHGQIGLGTLIWLAHEHGVDTTPHERLAAAQGWEAVVLDELPQPQGEAPPLKLAGAKGQFDCFRLSNNLANTYRRRLLAGGYVIPGEITIVAGAGGYGKTMWVLLLLLQLASGRHLLNQSKGRRLKTVFISLEEPSEEIFHKLRALVKHFGLPPHLLEDLLVFGNDKPVIQALTVTGPRGQPMVSEAGVAALDDIIRSTEAGVVAIDCLAPLAPVGANDNGLVYTLAARIKVILQKQDSALILIAHTRKGAQEDTGPDAVAGAAAWVNSARVVVWVKPATPAECEDIGSPLGQEKTIRKVSIEKANYSPRGGEAYVQMVSVIMNPATADYPEDSVGIIVPFQASPTGRHYPPGMLREMLEVIARGTSAGPYSSALQNGRGGKPGRYPIPALTPVIARHVSVQGDPAKRAAQAALGRLIETGWVVINTIKKGGHNATTLTVAWSATPWAADPPPPGTHVA